MVNQEKALRKAAWLLICRKHKLHYGYFLMLKFKLDLLLNIVETRSESGEEMWDIMGPLLENTWTNF